jgi:peptidyl-prolyl cis-trans isomerase B (cyclophilin B)
MAGGWLAGMVAIVVCLTAGGSVLAQRAAKPTRPTRFFETSLTPAQMAGKEAVVETTSGTFVIRLLPDAAPNHVGYFMKVAQEGGYNGTTFHRAVKHGIIQGGDPLSRDPAQRSRYGTGGLGVLRAELSSEPMTAGAVAAALQPGKMDSGGSQFFVLVTDQPALQGQHTIFGRVVEGLEVVAAISALPVDDKGRLVDRTEFRSVTIRDAAPPEPEPFSTETPAALAQYRAVLETSKGTLVFQFLPEKAPNHVRNFLRLASLGAYDGTRFHRVVRGFVVQGGMLDTRREPLPQRVRGHVRTLDPEFNDVPHLRGTVSMARLDDPASASTSFFICTGPAPSLDGQYSAFATVVDGLHVLDALEAIELNGESPVQPLELTRVRVERSQVAP